MPEHCESLQNPKTPKLTPWKVAIGMPLTTGVDITEITSRIKEAKSSAVKGVAGFSITATSSSCESTASYSLVGEEVGPRKSDPEVNRACRPEGNHGTRRWRTLTKRACEGW